MKTKTDQDINPTPTKKQRTTPVPSKTEKFSFSDCNKIITHIKKCTTLGTFEPSRFLTLTLPAEEQESYKKTFNEHTKIEISYKTLRGYMMFWWDIVQKDSSKEIGEELLNSLKSCKENIRTREDAILIQTELTELCPADQDEKSPINRHKFDSSSPRQGYYLSIQSIGLHYLKEHLNKEAEAVRSDDYSPTKQ